MSKIKTCVSLYSLQNEYMTKRMSLEDIFSFMRDNSVDGVEFLPDQMMHDAPDPSEETLKEWDRLCGEYGVKPVISDVFLNTNLYKNRELTKKECVKLLIDEIKLAHRLGMKMIRLVSMTPGYVLEPLLPYCEKYDVKMALEIHAGLSFDKQKTKDYIAEMKRLHSPYIGLVIDTGIFCRRIPRVMENYCREQGTGQAPIDYVNRLFEAGKDGRVMFDENGGFIPEFAALLKSGADHMYGHFADGYENEPYSVLDELMPYVFHIHFKLFEMTGQGEYSIDYKGFLQYLHDHDYDGYVATEYEGNRWTLAGAPMTEKEQTIAHQEYIRNCLKEIQG
ncbi:sugar phosphate isomerase/epimerase family protein [Enterocloster bolteae]|uniref:sugar phosphate isomerase/epimerase family protein n=1 Tax=Enterocloster bolteae TaxID=208479 RepID=UPI00210D6440|nr:TIM barrel protein [Enterocloster bolteae]MCQ5144453.1 sugar phosphate isomerase/epimerase [Enterocloster bolteae]